MSGIEKVVGISVGDGGINKLSPDGGSGIVWLCSDDGSILPRPLTIPSVMDPERPNGFPIATTFSPTLKDVEFPICNGTSLFNGTFVAVCTTAKSENGSPPTSFA